jgi:hypothetical protein
MKGSGRHLDEASRKLTADSSRHSQGVDANERRLLAGRPKSPATDSRGEPDGFPTGFPTVWVAPLSPVRLGGTSVPLSQWHLCPSVPPLTLRPSTRTLWRITCT